MAPKASVVASSPQMLRRPYSPAGSTSPAGNTSPPSSPAGNTSPPSRQMPISSPAGSSTSQKSSAKKRTATSPAGNIACGPKKVKDSACIGMLINARTEMMALGQARLIVALKERLDSDIEFAGMCNTLMERIDRSKVARVALHRNDRYLSDLKIWLMTMIFDRSLNCEGIDCDWSSVKKSFVKDLFEFLMQNYDFKTELPLKEGRVEAYCLLLTVLIICSPVYSTVILYLKRHFTTCTIDSPLLTPEVWNHRLGQWQFVGDCEVEGLPCFTAIRHRRTGVDVALPLGMRIPKAHTYGDKPDVCLEKNSSTASARVKIHSSGIVLPLCTAATSNLLQEEQKTSLCTVEEFKMLERLTTDKEFSMSQFLRSCRNDALRAHWDAQATRLRVQDVWRRLSTLHDGSGFEHMIEPAVDEEIDAAIDAAILEPAVIQDVAIIEPAVEEEIDAAIDAAILDDDDAAAVAAPDAAAVAAPEDDDADPNAAAVATLMAAAGLPGQTSTAEAL